MNSRVKTVFFVLALLVLFWLYFAEVRADDVTLTWVNPTGQESCSDAGPLEDLAGTRIWQLVTEINDPTATEYVIPGLLPGEYTYVATSFTTSGTESRISGSATKTVETFKAAAGAMVYQPVSINNAWWLLPVGTVTADIECITEQKVNDMYAVPNTGVTWSEGVVPRLLVVAQCR